MKRHRERNRKQMDQTTYLDTRKEAYEQRRIQARQLWEQEMSLLQIAEKLGVSLYTVKAYIYRGF